ncbi:MAG TPA: choice-of-anchor Q domain-containing protein [Vicinamibacterales bacterium]|nr:choice-of-anchor Q domain-containing protein [Vicinamibacterales bacterium]
MATPGFYYVDATQPAATDTSNTYGTPAKPRRTIPTVLAAGSVVELHGTYDTAHSSPNGILSNGTAAKPVFIRGASSTNKPLIRNEWEVRGSYFILENLEIGPLNSTLTGDLVFVAPVNHAALRYSDVHGNLNGGGVGVVSWDSNLTQNVVLFSDYIHDNGDVNANFDQDCHGIAVSSNVDHLWVLDSTLARNSGDGIQINGGSAATQPTTHHIYVGRNTSYSNKQTGFWSKQAVDVIFSQNDCHSHRISNSSFGQCMGYQYATEQIWFLFNHIYDSDSGIAVADDSDLGIGTQSYFIGNVIHNIHTSDPANYNPNTAWSTAGIMIAGGVNRHVINNTIYDVDAGINSPSVSGTLEIADNIIANVTQPAGNHVFVEMSSLVSALSLHHNVFFGDARINLADAIYHLTASQLTMMSSSSGDPRFANPAAADFHVLAGSSAIDKAEINSVYAAFQQRYGISIQVDRDGVARPQGRAMDMGAYEAAGTGRKTLSDFNGDGRSDPGIFRPSVTPNALWYSTPSGGGTPFQIFFGQSGDIPVVGDYDGDGKSDAVIWRPSNGLWYGPRTGAGSIVIQLTLGQNGDIPVACDYDGDGATDPAIYRPSTGQWFGTSTNGTRVVLNTNLGVVAGDIPVPADYDGDGKCDPAIMRPGAGPGGTNLWYGLLSGGGRFQIYFGAVGDIPAPGDYDGDGKADAVIFRPSNGLWYGPRTGGSQIVVQVMLGQNGDIPVPGDYDGNGTTDVAIYRPSTGMFYGVNSAGSAVVLNANLGVAARDISTAARPNPQSAYPFGFSTTTAQSTIGATPATAASTTTADAAPLAPGRAAALGGSAASDAPRLAPVTPMWGSGTSHLFTFSAVDPHGAGDISTVYAAIGSRVAAAGGCLIAYDRQAHALRLADEAGDGWSRPVGIGSADEASNAQCAVHGVGSSVAVSGDTVSVVVPITFDPAFAGAKTIFAAATTAAGATGGWQPVGSWTVAADARQAAGSAPLWGSGADGSMTIRVSTPGDGAALRSMQVLVNTTWTAAGACLVSYDAATRTMRLAADDGKGWSNPIAVGARGTISNSQCAVRGSDSAVSVSGTTLTAVLGVAFTDRFAGPKTIYGQAIDAAGDTRGWQPLGTWIVTASDAPAVASAVSAGSGLSRIVTLSASAAAHAPRLASVEALIGGDLVGGGSCWVAYDAAANTVRLANDGGDAWSEPMSLGGAGRIANSQCSIDAAGSAATVGNNDIRVTLAVTLDAGFAGAHNIYGLAVDAAQGSSNWRLLGAWNPQH